jgi:predicted nucleic acid-binding protein
MPQLLVVDCSVAAKWVVPEPGRDEALRLLDRAAEGELTLIAPDLLLAEFASLVAKRVRRKQLSTSQAEEAFALLCQFAPRLYDMQVLLPVALRMSVRSQLSLWDCVYIALAMEHECQMVTADRRLFRGSIARHTSVKLLE